MKRFLLFAWPEYEPSGGFDDLIGQYESHAEAQAAKPQYKYACSCGMIVDSTTGVEVENW